MNPDIDTDIRNPDKHQYRKHGYAWVSNCEECRRVKM